MSTAPVTLSLYDHVEDVLHLAAAIAQATPEEAEALTPLLQDALIGTARKVDRCAQAIAILTGNGTAAIAEMERQSSRAKLFTAAASGLKAYMLQSMERAGTNKMEGLTSTLRRQKNPPRVSVTEPGLVPAEFWRTQPAPPPQLDRLSIAEALARNETVPGCRMESGYHLRIS